MLKQNLQQKLLQKLSPQQIQLMKLLQVPTASLEERIEEELEQNPALEEGEDGHEESADTTMDETEEDRFEEDKTKEDEKPKDEAVTESIDDGAEEELYTNEKDDSIDTSLDSDGINDYLDEDDIAEYRYRQEEGAPENEETRGMPIAERRTFHDSLEEQLGMLEFDDAQRQIAEYIIGNIDDDGYLRRPLDAMIDDLAFSFNVEAEEKQLEDLLAQIQHLDPPGVGARDLKECLLIQLKRKANSEANKIAMLILENHFEEFAKKHYEKLQRSLGLSDEMLKEAINEIIHLNPKPGSTFSSRSDMENSIIPDFYILNEDGKLELSLNSMNMPELRISQSFREMLQEYNKGAKKDKKQKEAVLFIKQKIDGAKWFIDAIKQRQHTLLLTMNAIMEYQKEYFLTGDETKLHPMILKDVADRTGLDISTISRVANSKYVQTEFGTFRLKSFFSEALSTDSGEEVSTREVKKILSEFVEAENKKNPLSDDKLTSMLNERGYNIARRTVAKYREQLGIPVARLRKEL
jgi:RNA polymerase sigma-54 factor